MRKSARPKPIRPNIKCKFCNKTFRQLGGGSQQKYCSVHCRNAAFYKNRVPRRNEMQALQKENEELRKQLKEVKNVNDTQSGT